MPLLCGSTRPSTICTGPFSPLASGVRWSWQVVAAMAYVDLNELRAGIGETLEDEDKEHFGLFWPGKREARRLVGVAVAGVVPVLTSRRAPEVSPSIGRATPAAVFVPPSLRTRSSRW